MTIKSNRSRQKLDGWEATRAGYSAYATVRNFLIEVGNVFVLFDEKGGTVTGGAMIAAAIAASGLTPEGFAALVTFIESNVADILSFAAPFPELRSWIGWIIDHLDHEQRKPKL